MLLFCVGTPYTAHKLAIALMAIPLASMAAAALLHGAAAALLRGAARALLCVLVCVQRL